MVSMVEHASDDRVPAASSWLMSGAVAFGLVWLVLVMRTLQGYDKVPELFNPTAWTLLASAGVVLVIGWWRPAPWLMLLAVWLVLSVTWFTAAYRWMHLDDPDLALPG